MYPDSVSLSMMESGTSSYRSDCGRGCFLQEANLLLGILQGCNKDRVVKGQRQSHSRLVQHVPSGMKMLWNFPVFS